eukprot:1687034-Amphidinium_carterae.2
MCLRSSKSPAISRCVADLTTIFKRTQVASRAPAGPATTLQPDFAVASRRASPPSAMSSSADGTRPSRISCCQVMKMSLWCAAAGSRKAAALEASGTKCGEAPRASL